MAYGPEKKLQMQRTTMWVPRDLLAQIDARADRIGVSRTRLVERVLRDSVGRAEADLRDMILAPKEMPDDRQLDFLA